MNFLHQNPFFRLLLALSAGILLFPFYRIPNFVLYILIATSVLHCGFSFITKSSSVDFRYRWTFGLGTLICFFVLGHFLCINQEYNHRFEKLNKTSVFLAEVCTPTVEKPNSFRTEIKLQQTLENKLWKQTNGNAVIYLSKNDKAKQLLIGDQLMLRAHFEKPPGAENPDAFNYEHYLHLNGINASAYIDSASWVKTTHQPKFSVLRIANQLRSYLLSIYSHYGIKDLEFAVLAALTVGYTDDLSPDLRGSYSATGAMHILSVSGLHVGIVYAVIAFALSFLSKSRFQLFLKTTCINLLLWSYAFITGLSPSVIRSAMMFSFIAIGESFKQKSQIYNTVFMSAFFILLYNPNLIYNIGFQLSYSAVLSILIFYRPLTKLLPTRNKIVKLLRDLILVSLAAQIGTVPFTLYYFQSFPNYFLLTNLVAIPLSTAIIYTAIALLITSTIPTIATAIAYVLNFFLYLLNYAIVQIQHLPHSTSIIALSFTQMMLLTFFIACITHYYYTRKPILVNISLVSITCMLALTTFSIFETRNTSQLVIFSSSKNTHINFIANGKNYIYSTEISELNKIAMNYWRNNNIDTIQQVKNQQWFRNNYATFAGKNIIIADEKMWKLTTTTKALSTDILIIGHKLRPKIDKLLENYTPQLIVVDKTISPWYTEKIRTSCELRNIRFYSVAERGAYILTLNE